LDYGVLRPEWTGNRPLLQRRGCGGAADIVRDAVVWKDGTVEWHAAPAEYQLRVAGN
jgi:hypothetical protein